MKSVVKLKIELEVICDQDQAEQLLNGKLAQQVADNCFPQNKRRVIDARVIGDVELYDNTINILHLLEQRNKAQAKAVPNPSNIPMETSVEDDPNFINLL